ncbi:MAG TPA: peptidylprolyl isomerase [Eubacteriaceae bacterium]|nr:peptidylprolyl isomerase [Eubacteriaceae bacterium]
MSKTLATVNGKEITESDIDGLLQSLPPEQAQQYNTPQGKQGVLEELIAHELFYLDALDKKLNEEDQFKKELEVAREKLLKSYAISTHLRQADVTEEEMKQYYDENKENFVEPAQYNAKHILVDTKEEHDKIMDSLNEQTFSFDALAKAHSKCPSKDKGGDLGQFAKGQMVPEFDEAIENMELNEIKGNVKTQYGYHIILLKDRKPEREIPYEEIKPRIQQFILGNKQNELFTNKIAELKNNYTVEYKEQTS